MPQFTLFPHLGHFYRGRRLCFLRLEMWCDREWGDWEIQGSFFLELWPKIRVSFFSQKASTVGCSTVSPHNTLECADQNKPTCNECWTSNAIKRFCMGPKCLLQMHSPFVVLFSSNTNFRKAVLNFDPKHFYFLSVWVLCSPTTLNYQFTLTSSLNFRKNHLDDVCCVTQSTPGRY